MTATTPPRRAATPARVWVPAYGAPGLLTLILFALSRFATTHAGEGLFFAFGLTAAVITTVLGPACCLAWRVSHLDYRTEDDVADLGCRLVRAERDLAAMALTLQRLTQPEMQAVGGHWVPPGPAGPQPPLYVVRDDPPRPEWN